MICEKWRLVVLFIVLIVDPTHIVNPPVIDHFKIPTVREGHIGVRSVVKDWVLSVDGFGVRARRHRQKPQNNLGGSQTDNNAQRDRDYRENEMTPATG